MNIFVFTKNHFLITGLEHSLNFLPDCKCIHLDAYDEHTSTILMQASDDDVVLFNDEGFSYPFHIFNLMRQSKARALYSLNNTNYELHLFFGFTVLEKNFNLSKLVFLLYDKSYKRPCMFPRFTDLEKKILLLTLGGNSAHRIAKDLDVSSKTIYQHRMNITRKMGVRKTRDLANIPQGFIDYLYMKK